MSNVVLELKDIRKSFVQGTNQIDVLNGVNLTINQGEITALLGQSGSGKTTLLQIAGLLDQADIGHINICGTACFAANDATRTKLRLSSIGFVYQFHHLLLEFSALENVVIPQMVAGVSKKEATKNASEILGYLGLAKRLDHRPSELSGGEQQRVAIARAVVNKPALLLADEPTGNLDPKTANEVFNHLLKTTREIGLAALIVTHNNELAANADRILKLQGGVIS